MFQQHKQTFHKGSHAFATNPLGNFSNTLTYSGFFTAPIVSEGDDRGWGRRDKGLKNAGNEV